MKTDRSAPVGLVFVLCMTSTLSAPAQAITLQELFGFNHPSDRGVSYRQSQLRPTQSPVTTVLPISRQGLNYLNALGEGVDANGYYNSPFSTQSAWGVPLSDGLYRQHFGWEAERVRPKRVETAYGVYFEQPANVIRLHAASGPQYYDVSRANSFVFRVQNGQVIQQQLELNRW